MRIAWVFLVLIIGGAGYASYVVVTLPALCVHSIDVQIDGIDVSERDVLAAANIDRRGNLWLLDTARIAQRVEAIPYVDRADIRRTPPARLGITVSLREPAACVRSGSRTVTIDRRLRILQVGCARRSVIQIDLRDGDLGAPGTTATPPAVGTLLADGRALADARVNVRSIGEDSYGQVVAVDDSGVALLLGSDGDLAAKARLVGPVLAATRAGRAVRAIDLRAPATPTVQFR